MLDRIPFTRYIWLHLSLPPWLCRTVYFGVAMNAARISAVGLGGARIFRVVRSPSDDWWRRTRIPKFKPQQCFWVIGSLYRSPLNIFPSEARSCFWNSFPNSLLKIDTRPVRSVTNQTPARKSERLLKSTSSNNCNSQREPYATWNT